MLDVQGFFAAVQDPRAANARHALDEILLVALAATLCGAQTCVDIATFAQAKLPLLRRFVRLAHGAPSHDTFSRVFQGLDPASFEAAFQRFMAAFAEALAQDASEPDGARILSFDGKSLRGAVETARRTTPLHLVTAWAAEQRLVLPPACAGGRHLADGTEQLSAARSPHHRHTTDDALTSNLGHRMGAGQAAVWFRVPAGGTDGSVLVDGRAVCEDRAAPARRHAGQGARGRPAGDRRVVSLGVV